MTTILKALLWWPVLSVGAVGLWVAAVSAARRVYAFLGACEPGNDATWLSDQPVDVWTDEQVDDAFMALVSELEWRQA